MLDDDEVRVLTDDELVLVLDLADIREQKKDIERRERQARDAVLQVLQGANKGMKADGRPACVVQTQHRRGVDAKKLEALYPDVYEDVVTESEVTVLRLP